MVTHSRSHDSNQQHRAAKNAPRVNSQKYQPVCSGLEIPAEAGLLTSFIAALPFPVSQWLRRPFPYTVTASFRIRTGFSILRLAAAPLRYNFTFFQT